MCSWGVAGSDLDGLHQSLGLGLQDGPAASPHLFFAAGQPSEEGGDPLLHRRPASQTQITRRLLSRPAPDRLVGVEVRAVARQVHQPQPQARRPQVLPQRLAPSELAEGVPARCPRSPAKALACPGATGSGKLRSFRRYCSPPLPSILPHRSPSIPQSSSWPSRHAAGCWSPPQAAVN